MQGPPRQSLHHRHETVLDPPYQLLRGWLLVHHSRWGGASATLWRWGLGKEDDGLQNRVVINIQRNNPIPLSFYKHLPGEVGGAGFAFSHFPTLLGN
jgi:hypothetical protein